MSGALVKQDEAVALQLEGLRQVVAALQSIQSVDAVREIRDRARAVEAYTRQRDDAGAAVVAAQEVKLRAERRLGQLLGKPPTPEESGRRGGRGNEKKEKGSLAANPFRPDEVHRFRELADVPDPVFEAAIEKGKAAGAVTRAGVMDTADVAATRCFLSRPCELFGRVRSLCAQITKDEEAPGFVRDAARDFLKETSKAYEQMRFALNREVM